MSRRLPNEMARAGGSEWEILAVGPSYYEGNRRFGDLEPSHLIVEPGEQARIAGMPMYLTNNVHLAFWGDGVRKLMQERFDVVHCWDEPFNPLCAQIARLTPSNTAFTFYTFQNISKTYPPPFAQLERYTLRRSTGWIAAGSLVEKTLENRAGYRERVHKVLGLGVDTHQFRPDLAARAAVRGKLGWSDEDVVIGYLGRFTEAKGIKVMMDTLDKIAEPWSALFMGSGELESAIEAWSRQFPGRVRIVHNLPHGEVARHLNACDILCAPSQTTPIWKEQFGRMLVEAFACGVAVVTSDSGEIPTVVSDAAVVIPERDDEAWRTGLKHLLLSEETRKHYANLGLARVRAKYSWEILASDHLAFFEQMIVSKEGQGLDIRSETF